MARLLIVDDESKLREVLKEYADPETGRYENSKRGRRLGRQL